MSRFSPIDWLLGTVLHAHGGEVSAHVVVTNDDRTGIIQIDTPLDDSLGEREVYWISIEKIKGHRIEKE